MALGLGAFLVALLPVQARRRPRLVRRTVPSMGTTAELAVVHPDLRYAHAALDAAEAELHRVDGLMTRFRSASDVGRANLHAAEDAVPVSPETALVLREGLRWAEATDGAFDPCIGRVVALWAVGERREPPPRGDVARLAGRHFHRAVDVGTHRGRAAVRFGDPDLGLDLGGIAKGYAVDRAVDVLRAWGIAHGLVNAGGDLYALGAQPGGEAWRIGVRDPLDPAGLSGVLEVRDRAVATSGDYEQFFEHANVRYAHIMDPASAAPRRAAARSVTVTGDTCMEADTAATAVFGLDREKAERLFRVVAPDVRIV